MFRSWAYPGGVAAPALLMLRLQAGLLAVTEAIALGLCSGWPLVPLVLVMLALLIGLFTRATAALVTAGGIGLAVAQCGATGLAMFTGSLACAALALLGAGAWSLDARMFGRRMILLRRMR
jgi:hypothetical protein